MAIRWALTFVTASIALACARGTPVLRERRFLVDSIVNGAKTITDGVTGTFSRLLGLEFKVKDSNQALFDADLIRTFGHEFNDQGIWFTLAAESYRKSLYHQDAHVHLDEWKTAASLLTRLADELLLDDKNFIQASTWIRLSITATIKPEKTKKKFQDVLKTIADGTQRLENLLPEVTRALTQLQGVVGPEAKEDVEKTLKKVTKTKSLVKKVRETYESLVKAVGISD